MPSQFPLWYFDSKRKFNDVSRITINVETYSSMPLRTPSSTLETALGSFLAENWVLNVICDRSRTKSRFLGNDAKFKSCVVVMAISHYQLRVVVTSKWREARAQFQVMALEALQEAELLLKQKINASHCLKITQNVSFEFWHFGIFHQFLSY